MPATSLIFEKEHGSPLSAKKSGPAISENVGEAIR